jgi:hypothetical protein
MDEGETSRKNITRGGDVFPPARLRRGFLHRLWVDGEFLLDQLDILFYIAIPSWIILFLF